MKRLKTTLATIMLITAAAAAIGLGTVMAVAALVIGLVVAGATGLAVDRKKAEPATGARANDTDISEGEIVTAG